MSAATVAYPDDRLVVDQNGRPQPGVTVPLFADAANVTAAPISLTKGGPLIPGSTVVTDEQGMLPVFYGPGGSLFGPKDPAGVASELLPRILVAADLGAALVLTVAGSQPVASAVLTPGVINVISAAAGAGSLTLPAGLFDGQQMEVSRDQADTSLNVITVTGKISGVAGSQLTIRQQHQSHLLAWRTADSSWYPVAVNRSLVDDDDRYVVAATTPPWAAPEVWASGKPYTASPVRAVVTQGGAAYVALKASTGVVPGTDASTWLPIAQGGIGKPCPDLQIGVSALVDFDVDGNGWKAIPNSSVAPATTAPIEIEFLLPYYALSAKAGQTAPANATGRVRLVDDLGAVVPGGFAALTTPTSLTGGVTCGGSLSACGVVTPASAARTYALQHQVSAAHAVGAMYANDAQPGMYPILKVRFA